MLELRRKRGPTAGRDGGNSIAIGFQLALLRLLLGLREGRVHRSSYTSG
jgi:hypothetical protein